MTFAEAFEFCPRCGARRASEAGAIPFHCEACGFDFFFNPPPATGVLICDREDRLLLIERARDPAKGKLGLPGGFVDPHETIEEAARREAKEEVNLDVHSLRYLASFPNIYIYKGIDIPVVDLFFTGAVNSFDELSPEEGEVRGWKFYRKNEIDLDRIAFPSVRSAIQLLQTI